MSSGGISTIEAFVEQYVLDDEAREELPDPTTFVIGDTMNIYGICEHCSKNTYNPLSKVTLFMRINNIRNKSRYLCRSYKRMLSRDSTPTCDHVIVVDNEYNDRCRRIVTNLVSVPGSTCYREILEDYIKYYNEREPPTKPALEE